MAIGKNIKGITIEFNGDTTKLGEALKKVEAKTKDIDSELKSVNRALKFNPGNVELLEQKQKILGSRIGETKKQLEALRDTQAKLDEDPSVDNNSQDYRELRREIIETESKLKHFEGQLQKTGDELKKIDSYDFEKLGGQFEKVGGKMKDVGAGMTKYVTAPIVGVGAASAKAWQEVDNGLDIVTQKTGASGKALQGMQESVKNLAQQIPTDFETAGSAIGEVNTRFGLTGSALEELSGKFIKFAQLNDTDVSESVDKVQKVMEAYGLKAEDAGMMLDTLNKVGQDTGIGMDQLSESLVTNAASLQGMGFDAQQAAFFVGQLEKSGIDGAKVMTGLNKAIVNGAKEGKALPEVMSEIQNSIVGASTEAEAMNAASEIFGSKAGPAIATAARNGSLDFDALASAATDASGSLENTFNETLDPADKFQTMMNSLKVTGYEIAESVLTIIGPALESLSGWLQNLAQKWSELSPETQKFIIMAAGFLAAVGPMLMALGQVATGIGAIIEVVPGIVSGFKMVGTAFSELKGILLSNPWVLVAAAAVAAIILIVKHWDQIKEFFKKLWETIKTVATTAWTNIKNTVVGLVVGIKDGILGAFRKIGETIKTIVSTWFDIITWPYRKAWETIQKIAQKIKDVFNFKFKLPHIKLPHFSISPRGWKLGDLLKGSIPSLGIDWYADGAIFRSPTIIGNKGFGEAGAEAALPLDVLWDQMSDMFSNMADRIVEGVNAAGGMDGAVITTNVILDGKVVGRAVTPIVNGGLHDQSVLDRRRA